MTNLHKSLQSVLLTAGPAIVTGELRCQLGDSASGAAQTSALGHQEPPALATAAAGLAQIADASEAWRRSTDGRLPPRRRLLPTNQPPRQSAAISALRQWQTSALNWTTLGD